MLCALDALVPPTPAAAEVLRTYAPTHLRTTRAYVVDNAARMDYPCFVAQQLPIGSGAVESVCKSVIEAREKQDGMRWTRRGPSRGHGAWAAFCPVGLENGRSMHGHLRAEPPCGQAGGAGRCALPGNAHPELLLAVTGGRIIRYLHLGRIDQGR